MTQRERSRRWMASPKGKAYRKARLQRLKRLGLCVNCGTRKGRPHCLICIPKIKITRRKHYRRTGMLFRNKYLYGNDAAEHMTHQLRKQRKRCAICRKKLIKPQQDHDRKCCPSVKTCGWCKRGALCGTCNTFLGKVEQKGWLKAALQYLKDWQR